MMAQGQESLVFMLSWIVIDYGCAILACVLAALKRKVAALAVGLPALFLASFTLVVGGIFRLPDALLVWIPVALAVAAIVMALRIKTPIHEKQE